jgi:hypothetical protein
VNYKHRQAKLTDHNSEYQTGGSGAWTPVRVALAQYVSRIDGVSRQPHVTTGLLLLLCALSAACNNRTVPAAVCPTAACNNRTVPAAVCPTAECNNRTVPAAVCPTAACNNRTVPAAVCPTAACNNRTVPAAVCPTAACNNRTVFLVDCRYHVHTATLSLSLSVPHPSRRHFDSK